MYNETDRNISGEYQQKPVLSEGVYVPDVELVNGDGRQVRLLDHDNWDELTACVDILTSTNNRDHLAGAPKNPHMLLERAMMPGKHFLVISTDDSKEIAGMGVLNDPGEQENDSMITNVAVHESLQRTKSREEDDHSIGYGRKLMEGIIKYGFNTPIKKFDGETRERTSIHMAVVMFVDGWERMYGLARHLAFEPKVIWGNQYVLPNGKLRDTIRMELKRHVFEDRVRRGVYATIKPEDMPAEQ